MPLCDACEQANERVEHYLQDCPAYAEQCARFQTAVHRELDSIVKVLSSPKMLPHLFKYITSTKQFTEQYGDLTYKCLKES